MKRFLLISTFLILCCFKSDAAHIIGGEMRYDYLGPGIPGTNSYRITLILFRDRGGGGAQLAFSYVVGIYNNDNGLKVIGPAANNNWTITQQIPPGLAPVPIVFPTCIQSPPVLDYEYAVYTLIIDLPPTLAGYTIAYQTCCRINGIMNVGNSVGATYSCVIPGTNRVPTGDDSSPQFDLPVNVICQSPATFSLNFSAVDPNGDSLVYRLCDAYNGGLATNAAFDDPAGPPYGSVIYNFPYSSSDPFGSGATINSQTGIISGQAPTAGKYVVCVCIDVYKNGVLITTHRKDLIVQVSDCEIPVAQAMPSFVTCDGFNIQFSHTSTGANTVFWEFGDPTTLADTSDIGNPSWDYTAAGAGTYIVKFVINRGTSCADSTTRTIGVWPGFFPEFAFTGGCFTNPFQFTDNSSTVYGVVDSWSWNFGDLTTLADTSHAQNPTWTYANAGLKTVKLVVTNSKGCIDSTTTDIEVFDKPPLALAFRDTLICRNDAVQLNASGTGTWFWTPNQNISSQTTPNPTVNPPNTTWYYVTLDDRGCQNRDSVQVRVVANVTLQARADTTICLTDSVQLYANSDGLTFQWSPASTLNDPNVINPIAVPDQPMTRYTVTASIGSCSTSDFVDIFTVPYPVALAGPDDTVCYNTSTQLNASHDGISFSWSPVTYLSNPNILNPVVTPPRTTSYTLTVYDTVGCPKPGRDTITVYVSPKFSPFAGRDTTVVVNQPLQFNASGGVSYFWIPSTGLSDPAIFNPVGIYGPEIDSIRYKVIISNAIGCPDSAYVTVRVFKTVPTVFVPTAFTPDGNGLNDVVRPIAVGIQKINYFNIYNRWGQLVFSTTVNGHGWDGRIRGKDQASAVFVWTVSALDYLGRNYFAKGTVTLIR